MSRDRSPPSAEKNVIRFYSVSAEYGELSNFALYPITLKGKRWSTSEHYFQAQKFVTARDQEEVRDANTPMLAARWGRDRKRKLRRDWERIKVGVMREAVEAKFRQHDELRALFLWSLHEPAVIASDDQLLLSCRRRSRTAIKMRPSSL